RLRPGVPLDSLVPADLRLENVLDVRLAQRRREEDRRVPPCSVECRHRQPVRRRQRIGFRQYGAGAVAEKKCPAAVGSPPIGPSSGDTVRISEAEQQTGLVPVTCSTVPTPDLPAPDLCRPARPLESAAMNVVQPLPAGGMQEVEARPEIRVAIAAPA